MEASIISSRRKRHFLTQQRKDNQNNRYSYCSIQWRQGQLLVKEPGQLKQPLLTPLENQEYLVKCLQHSPVSLVRIDPVLGENKVKLWADACDKAAKPIFLRVPSTNRQGKSSAYVWLKLRRVFEWLISLILLGFLAPIMLGIMAFMRLNSKGSLFEREWHISERGRLFRIFKFRTHQINAPVLDGKLINYQESLNDLEGRYNFISFEKWMSKHGLENLPQLFNVLRGEMSLFGSRCLTLEEAVLLSPQQQQKLNKLPGIIGLWEVEPEAKLLHLDGQTS